MPGLNSEGQIRNEVRLFGLFDVQISLEQESEPQMEHLRVKTSGVWAVNVYKQQKVLGPDFLVFVNSSKRNSRFLVTFFRQVTAERSCNWDRSIYPLAWRLSWIPIKAENQSTTAEEMSGTPPPTQLSPCKLRVTFHVKLLSRQLQFNFFSEHNS